MSLGSYPLGAGPLGFAPVAAASAAGARQPQAHLFSPMTHDAVLLPGGSLLAAHPVDQAVALALGIKRGSIGSAPDQGNTLGDIEHAGRDLESQVEQRVQQALSVLIDRGDIRLDGVVTVRQPSGWYADVNYQNLRLLPAALRSQRLQG